LAETTSATITATQIDSTHWQYSITLDDTGSTTVGTFWFAWVPGQDFLESPPTNVVSPSGWTDNITHFGQSDGYAIQWIATSGSSDVPAGGTLSGFAFTSTDAPSAVFGNSVFYPNTPVLTSFVYSQGPFSDGGFDFQVTEAACFLPGTRILTEAGEVPVEDLRVGDSIVTLGGRTRRLCWIGEGHVQATPGWRNAATPITVCKGALGEQMPNRDLHVTKGHSLFLDDVLIPVEFLVNHRSIVWNDRARDVTVYHLELDAHDILLANGAPAESYRDDGNRWLFRNANTGWDLPPKPACAAVLTDGPVVDAVWQRILERAGPRPGLPLTDDPDLHLLIDGVRVDASKRMDGVHVFALRGVPREARMISRAAAPQELGLARDPRCLGVAVRRIIVRQRARSRIIRAQEKLLGLGFHAYEAGLDLKWSDGDALLPSEMFAGFTGAFEVSVHLGGTATYIESVATDQAA
jgi:Hint domain